jgi:hypothetical protein
VITRSIAFDTEQVSTRLLWVTDTDVDSVTRHTDLRHWFVTERSDAADHLFLENALGISLRIFEVRSQSGNSLFGKVEVSGEVSDGGGCWPNVRATNGRDNFDTITGASHSDVESTLSSGPVDWAEVH